MLSRYESQQVRHRNTEAEKAAYEQSFEGYCQSVEDFLDCRPISRRDHDNPERESLLLKWGREQGLQGLEGDIPLSRAVRRWTWYTGRSCGNICRM